MIGLKGDVMVRERLLRTRRDDGLTIIEISVAIGIFAVALVLLTALISNNLRGILLGKQRGAANTVAQEVLERARAVNYATLGLSGSDPTLAADPDVLLDGSGTRWFGPDCSLGVPPPPGRQCEQIVEVASPPPPFDVHRVDGIRRGPTTMSRWIYVTAADQNDDGVPDDSDNDGVFDLIRVTARVEWGNPGVVTADNRVRVETLIDPSRVDPPPFLNGSAFVKNGSVNISSSVDGVTSSFRQLMPIAELSSNASPALELVSCFARAGVVAGPTGSTWGPTGVTTLADNDPSNATPPTDVQEADFDSPPPSDVASLLDPPPSSYPGTMRCFTSVEAVDPQATAPTGIPFGHGTASNSPTELRYHQDVEIPELEDLLGNDLFAGGTVETFRVGESDAIGITDTGPGPDILTETATQAQGEQRFVAFATGIDVLNLLNGLSMEVSPDVGLVRVEQYNVQATANGRRAPTNPATDGSSSVSGTTIRTWVFDPPRPNLVGPPTYSIPDSTCNGGRAAGSGSGTPDYCIIERSPNTSLGTIETSQSFGLSASLGAASLGAQLRYETTLTGGAATPAPIEGPGAVTWRAQANPLFGSTRVCVTTGSTCDSGTVLVDVRSTFDSGTLTAEVVGGK